MREGFTEATDSRIENTAVREVRGAMRAEGLRFALVVARFNPEITEALLQGAIDTLTDRGAGPGDIHVVRVPGAWELAPATRRVVERGQVDAVIAIGCVIRGDTPHFEFVAGEAARGLGELSRAAPVPVVFGVLTTDDRAQARARSSSGSGNKGREAALAGIEMANLYRALA